MRLGSPFQINTSKSRASDDVARQVPVDLAALQLSGGPPQSDYIVRADDTFAIHVELGSTLGMDPFDVLMETITQGLPAYHPEHADTWITFARGASGRAVSHELIGDGAAVLSDDYANVRMFFGFLFFGISGQRDFELHAVRPRKDAQAIWLQFGAPSSEDASVIELDLSHCSSGILRHHMRSNQLLDTWWRPVENAKGK